MASSYAGCPVCGHADLAPRHILVGQHITTKQLREYREILTLKCQNCGWLGEQLAESAIQSNFSDSEIAHPPLQQA